MDDIKIIQKETSPQLKKIYISALILILMGISYYSGLAKGEERINKNLEGIQNETALKPEDVDFGVFWKAWQIINEKYVDNDKVLTQDKVWGAISGLAESTGDPYTSFFPPEENKMFEDSIRGNFGGVGMEVGIREDVLTVVSPLKSTPAERAGILSGDKILAIDGEGTSALL